MKTRKIKVKGISGKQIPKHGRTLTLRPEEAVSKAEMSKEELAAALSRCEDWKMARRRMGMSR